MTEQIFYCKSQGIRVPVRLEIFKHGGGVYLAISNQAENINIPFFGPAPAMVARLREAADLIEAASRERDQGHISRRRETVDGRRGREEKASLSRLPSTDYRLPTLSDLNGDPRHDFPVFVRRFAKSSPDIVAAIAQVYKTKGYKVPGMEAILQGYDDLDSVWVIRGKVVNTAGELVYGARNRIAKALGIRDAGNYRQRIDTVIWLLKHAPLEDYQAELEVLESEVRSFEPKVPVSNTRTTRAKSADSDEKRSAAA